MRANIIVKDGREKDKVLNIAGYIEMVVRRPFGKVDCQMVGDDQNTVIFNVRTRKKTFRTIKAKIEELYPGLCVYLSKK